MLQSNLQTILISLALSIASYYLMPISTFIIIILAFIFYVSITTFKNTEIMSERKDEKRISSKECEDILSGIKQKVNQKLKQEEAPI
jgi:phosphotransferase system  glucose/maltose/N-acetylglucosamine-specific IIC component